jgi:surface protein
MGGARRRLPSHARASLLPHLPCVVRGRRAGPQFSGASSFNGDLSSWNVASVSNMNNMVRTYVWPLSCGLLPSLAVVFGSRGDAV